MLSYAGFISRGNSFRSDYKATVFIRGIFTNATTMLLSATLTEKIVKEIDEILEWSPKLIAIPPDRPNIMIEVVRKSTGQYSISEDLQWVVDGLETMGKDFPKTIIFSQSIKSVMDLCSYIKRSLGDKFYVDEKHEHKNRLATAFHGNNAHETHRVFLSEFAKRDCNLRCMCATVCLGMGIEFLDVATIVIWGMASNSLQFWQQGGRAGRDGSPAKVIYYPAPVNAKCDDDDEKEFFRDLKEKTDGCLRKMLLSKFILPGMAENCLDYLDKRPAPCREMCDEGECQCSLCKCCTNCRNTCDCVA